MLAIIGDIHAHFQDYSLILQKLTPEFICSVQIGDFGLGFNYVLDEKVKQFDADLSEYHRFFRGNHDDPDRCGEYAMNLGEYGYWTKNGKTVFFVAGAWSIDSQYRTEGRDWWRDEELRQSQMLAAQELYRAVKPDYVLSHDAPDEVLQLMYAGTGRPVISTKTSQFLQALLSDHAPEKWYFGHHHRSKTIMWNNQTVFRCVDINECVIDQDMPNFQNCDEYVVADRSLLNE